MPPTFEIPTGPSITERGHTLLISEAQANRGKALVKKPPYGSLAYDREKGTMPLEWRNEAEFLAWLSAEESDNGIQLILSRTVNSDSPTWWARRVYRCSREFSGGQPDRANMPDRKILAMKSGCRCRVTVKVYPDTETVCYVRAAREPDLGNAR
ncbi:hypothetical protein EI94DRAFT_1800802 [Lactarius quietus]|nr:hypothetical protein EI94DRAFT_1800802 [Lactarius quietus]